MIISQFSFLILPNVDKNLDITLKITGNHDFSLQLSGTTGCLAQALGWILLAPWDGLKEGPWNRRKQGASDDSVVSLDGFIVIITVLSCGNCLKNIWVQLTLIPKPLCWIRAKPLPKKCTPQLGVILLYRGERIRGNLHRLVFSFG